MSTQPSLPRLSLLGLPRELQAKVVEEAARQDAEYRSRIYWELKEEEDGVDPFGLQREGFGRSLEALSLTCKALRVFAEEHLFATLVASRAKAAIFDLGLTSKYGHAFRTIVFDPCHISCLEYGLVASTFFPNLREVAISSEALVALLDRVPFAAFAPVGRNARSLDLYGSLPLEDSVVIPLLHQFPLLQSLTIANDACACLGDDLAALIAARPLLTSLSLHLSGNSQEARFDYPLPPCWIASPSTATFTSLRMTGHELSATKLSAVRSLVPHLEALRLAFTNVEPALSQTPFSATNLKHLILELSETGDDEDDVLAAFFPPLLEPFAGAPITILKLVGPTPWFDTYPLLPRLPTLFPKIQSLTLHPHPSNDLPIRAGDIKDAERLSRKLGYHIKTEDRELYLRQASAVHRDADHTWPVDDHAWNWEAEHRAAVKSIRRILGYARRRINTLEWEEDVIETRHFLGLFVALEADRLRMAD